MIWIDGRVVPDEALTIPVLDRTLEHGVGLFETFRTWSGHAPLLEAHKARMLQSAGDLRIPLDPARLPDRKAVRSLVEAQGGSTDRIVRITATGGSQSDSLVWMRSPFSIDGKTPMPPALRVELGTLTISPDDPLARHKTLNYWSRRIAAEMAGHRGFHETLVLNRKGVYGEGGYSNLFVVAGDRLLTPSLKAPILPGIMRRLVLELAKEIGWPAKEVAGIRERQLLEADEVFLTNSVRGIFAVGHAAGSKPERSRDWPAPGPWTRRLQAMLADRLPRGNAQ
jgi:branched-subunit amino acid aminotransferase/4-amino-4-deoxychorismate lyase